MNIRKIQREIERRHDAILKELHAKPRKTKAVPATEKTCTESVAESVPSAEAVLIAPAVPMFTRSQARERCKLAYSSGVATLSELADQYAIPYDTLSKWCAEEKWSAVRELSAAVTTGDALANKAPSWLVEQQQEQIQRSIRRAVALQGKADDAIRNAESSEDGLTPQAVRDSATTEEKLDAIIRRNLSMDTQAQGGARLNLNVLGNVSLISPM